MIGWPYVFIRIDGSTLRDLALNDAHARQKAAFFPGIAYVCDGLDGRIVWQREGE